MVGRSVECLVRHLAEMSVYLTVASKDVSMVVLSVLKSVEYWAEKLVVQWAEKRVVRLAG